MVYNDPAGYKRELLEIGFASPQALEPGAGDELVITGMAGRPWQRENAYGFKAGFAVSAESVSFKPPSRREPAAA